MCSYCLQHPDHYLTHYWSTSYLSADFLLPAEEAAGDTFAIITVLAELRVKESFNTNVSLEALMRNESTSEQTNQQTNKKEEKILLLVA